MRGSNIDIGRNKPATSSKNKKKLPLMVSWLGRWLLWVVAMGGCYGWLLWVGFMGGWQPGVPSLSLSLSLWLWLSRSRSLSSCTVLAIRGAGVANGTYRCK